MIRVAITGHRELDPRTTDLVATAVRDHLRGLGPNLTGVSCLADGADQIFARAVLESGGLLEVTVPAAEYRERLPAHSHPGYDDLLARARAVHRLEFVRSDEDSHMAASIAMLRGADRLFAVWDGKPARGYGGTADVVRYAQDHGVPVTVIWPDGARR